MAGPVSTTLSEWLLVALILFSQAFEILLHKLEHWVHHHHHHLVAVLRVLYRELMILGVVSFSFICYELIAKPSKIIIYSFEFAHIFIFLFAIFYTFVVLCSMLFSLNLSARWKKMERMDLVYYLSLREKYAQLKQEVNFRSDPFWNYIWWIPNVSKLLRYMHMHEVMTFHDIRFQFIYYRNLPEHFRFSSFLRKIKSHTFVELVESHWSLYLIFLIIVLCDILRRIIITGSASGIKDTKKLISVMQDLRQQQQQEMNLAADDNSHPSSFAVRLLTSVFRADKSKAPKYTEQDSFTDSVFVICASIILAVFTQILAMKIRRVYWHLTKHPRTYYEDLRAEEVAEELRKASEQHAEARRRSRSISRRGEDSTAGNSLDLGGLVENNNNNNGESSGAPMTDDGAGVDTGNEADDESGASYNMPGILSEADPEIELLDPMRPQPLHSPLHNHNRPRAVSTDLTEHKEAEVTITTTELKWNEADHAELHEISMRHSLERPSVPQPPAAASAHPNEHKPRAVTDLTHQTNAAGDGHGTNGGVSGGAQVRHSVDIARPKPGEGGAMASSAVQSTSASIARAALEAARRRAMLKEETQAATQQQQQELLRQQQQNQAKEPSPLSETQEQQLQYGRQSLDVSLRRNPLSPRKITSALSSRRGSLDEEAVGRMSMGDSNRGSIEGRRGGNRTSIELAVVMKREDLRAHFEQDERPPGDRNKEENALSRRAVEDEEEKARREQRIRFAQANSQKADGEVRIDMGEEATADVDVGSGKHSLEKKQAVVDLDGQGREEDYSGIEKRSSRHRNATILTHFTDHLMAQNREPAQYPRVVNKLIPRLGRVASRAEKLFWFGSHKFFMWCVEFVLFFSTVLLAATTAGTSLRAVREMDVEAIHYVAVALALLNLIFVLLRIGVIIKRYIFIIHNASLIPEVVALEAIQDVRQKRIKAFDEDGSAESGSETEHEDGDAAKERRRRLGNFFRTEAESGNIPGIDTSAGNSRTSWDIVGNQKRRLRERRNLMRQRRLARNANQMAMELEMERQNQQGVNGNEEGNSGSGGGGRIYHGSGKRKGGDVEGEERGNGDDVVLNVNEEPLKEVKVE